MSAGSPCAEMADSVTRYAHRDMTGAEEARVAKHLRECPSCREFADFVEGFIETGKPREPQPPVRPCPETSLIVALEADELDKEATERVFAHVLRCDACRHEYLLLRSVSEQSPEEAVSAIARVTRAVVQALRKAGTVVLNAVSVTGTGQLLAPALVTTRSRDSQANPVEIEDVLMDARTGETSVVRVKIAPDAMTPAVTVRIQADPPQTSWKARLFGPDKRELASLPLDAPESVLGTRLPYGFYAVTVTSKDKTLARFALQIEPSKDR